MGVLKKGSFVYSYWADGKSRLGLDSVSHHKELSGYSSVWDAIFNGAVTADHQRFIYSEQGATYAVSLATGAASKIRDGYMESYSPDGIVYRKPHWQATECAAASPDGKALYFFPSDAPYIRAYDLPLWMRGQYSELQTPIRVTGWVDGRSYDAAKVSNDGKLLAVSETGGYRGRVYNVETGDVVLDLPDYDKHSNWSFSFNEDSTLVAVSSDVYPVTSRVRIYSTLNGALVSFFGSPSNQMHGTFTGSGDELLLPGSTSDAVSGQVYDARTKQVVRQLPYIIRRAWPAWPMEEGRFWSRFRYTKETLL